MASVIDSIVKQAGDTKKSMDWYRQKVRDATGSGTTARGLIRCNSIEIFVFICTIHIMNIK